MLIMSNIGDHVWLMTSRHTDPDLIESVIWGFSLWKDWLFINIGMEYSIHESDRRWFVRILIRQFDVNFPSPFCKRCCWTKSALPWHMSWRLTLWRSFENHKELLHVIIHQRHLVVTHHELHDICFYSPFRTTHLAALALCACSPVELSLIGRLDVLVW